MRPSVVSTGFRSRVIGIIRDYIEVSSMVCVGTVAVLLASFFCLSVMRVSYACKVPNISRTLPSRWMRSVGSHGQNSRYSLMTSWYLVRKSSNDMLSCHTLIAPAE